MDLTQHAAFPVLAICSAVLVFKMIVVGHVTGAMRFRRSSFATPEDLAAFGEEGAEDHPDHPDVARYQRAHKNDLESTLPFLAVSVLYLGIDPSPGLATGIFIWFTLFRVLYTVFYLMSLQPWRTISFLVAEISVIVMIAQMAWWGVGNLS